MALVRTTSANDVLLVDGAVIAGPSRDVVTSADGKVSLLLEVRGLGVVLKEEGLDAIKAGGEGGVGVVLTVD